MGGTRSKRGGKSSKYYAVAVGRKAGIYRTWADCQAQVKGYSKACFKSFPSEAGAQTFLKANGSVAAAFTSANASIRINAGQTSSRAFGTQRESTASVPRGRGQNLSRETAGTADATTASTGSRVAPSSSSSRSKPSAASYIAVFGPGASLTDKGLHIEVSFDGGARGNPGIAGAGAEILTRYRNSQHDRTVQRSKIHMRRFVGRSSTNNEAEYAGLLAGLAKIVQEIQSFATCRHLSSKQLDCTVAVKGDSNMIIQQLLGNYRCNSPNLKPLYREANSLIAQIRSISQAKISFQHVYRDHNKTADRLANEAMDSQRSWVSHFGEDGNEVDGDATQERFEKNTVENAKEEFSF